MSKKKKAKLDNLGFSYGNVMCYNDGSYYVLCEQRYWQLKHCQVMLPKLLKSIGKIIIHDKETNDKKEVFIPKSMKNELTKDLIDAYLNDTLTEFIDGNKPNQKVWPEYYTPKDLIEKIDMLASFENKQINQQHENLLRRNVFKQYHKLLKHLRNNTVVYTLKNDNNVYLLLGSTIAPKKATSFSLGERMSAITTVICRISNREFRSTLNYTERNMKSDEFLYYQLPLIFNTFDIAGDKISVEALNERDFLNKNLYDIAKKLNLELPKKPIMFNWSSIGDKIVAKHIKRRYNGRIHTKEFHKIISNKNMADTLLKLDLIDKEMRTKHDEHKLGTVFEALIYVANKTKNEEVLQKLLKKLVHVARGW